MTVSLSALSRANCSTPGASRRQVGQWGAQNHSTMGRSEGAKLARLTLFPVATFTSSTEGRSESGIGVGSGVGGGWGQVGVGVRRGRSVGPSARARGGLGVGCLGLVAAGCGGYAAGARGRWKSRGRVCGGGRSRGSRMVASRGRTTWQMRGLRRLRNGRIVGSGDPGEASTLSPSGSTRGRRGRASCVGAGSGAVSPGVPGSADAVVAGSPTGGLSIADGRSPHARRRERKRGPCPRPRRAPCGDAAVANSEGRRIHGPDAIAASPLWRTGRAALGVTRSAGRGQSAGRRWECQGRRDMGS